MSTVLPDQLDPWRAVKNGLSFAGELPVARFPRLLEVGRVATDAIPAAVTYQLDFRRDAERGAVVEGWAQVRLCVRCERCLCDLWLDLDAPLALQLVRVEPNANAAASDYEPLVVTDDLLDPLALIEDELLLAIPPFPRHRVGECQAPEVASWARNPVYSESDDLSDADVADAPRHPFAVLERLKRS